MEAQLLSYFIVNLFQPQLTQFQLNFDSTSLQSQPQINLSLNINLNLTSTSTQHGCDIKATQSCYILILVMIFGVNDCKNTPETKLGLYLSLHVCATHSCLPDLMPMSAFCQAYKDTPSSNFKSLCLSVGWSISQLGF